MSSTEQFWFKVYSTAFRGHFAPPPSFRDLKAGSMPQLHLTAFQWKDLVCFRSTLANGLPAAERLTGGLSVEDAPSGRAGMLDASNASPGGFFSSQKGAVLQQPLQPLPLARPVAYVELLVNGGASVGLVTNPQCDNQHIGWGRGTIGYHGDSGDLYISSGGKAHSKIGPTFGLDPEMVLPNDAGHAPRHADCVGVGIDYRQSSGDGGSDSPLLLFTKNGELVAVMRLPGASLRYFAFALHRRGDCASVNVGTSRFYFDVEAYSQRQPPEVTVTL